MANSHQRFFLIIGVYFTTLSIPSFAAATLPEQQTCPDGQEKDGALCYPKCDSGYTGVGPLCWETCPSGYTDTGAFCTKVVPQKNYGRPDGIIPNGCPAGQENQAGLCYKPCDAGDSAEGPLCFKPCPAGTKDIGVLCSSTTPKDTYTRAVGTIPNVCPAGQENQAGLCYKPCNAGDSAEGPLCFKPCPAGTKDIGVLCSSTTPKDTYTRAVGTIPNSCAAGKENKRVYVTRNVRPATQALALYVGKLAKAAIEMILPVVIKTSLTGTGKTATVAVPGLFLLHVLPEKSMKPGCVIPPAKPATKALASCVRKSVRQALLIPVLSVKPQLLKQVMVAAQGPFHLHVLPEKSMKQGCVIPHAKPAIQA